MICANDFNPLSRDGAVLVCANEIAASGNPSMAQRAPMNAIGAFHWRSAATKTLKAFSGPRGG